MSSTKGKNDPNRIERDRYETPQWCIDALAERVSAYINTPTFGQIIDIGAGDGRIGRTVKNAWTKNETETIENAIFLDVDDPKEKLRGEKWLIKDFLEIDIKRLSKNWEQPSIFVSNPPFSLSDEIIAKTIRWMYANCNGKSAAIFLHRLNWLGSGQRAEFINTFPPTRLTILSPRVSFCKKTKIVDGKVKTSNNDSCEYAWIWWEMARDLYDDTPFIEVAVRPGYKPKKSFL